MQRERHRQRSFVLRWRPQRAWLGTLWWGRGGNPAQELGQLSSLGGAWSCASL